MAIGAAAAAYFLPQLGQPFNLELIGGVLLGSLILDLDHPKGKLNQKILPIKNKAAKLIVYTAFGLFLLTHDLGIPGTFSKILAGFLIMVGISSHRSFTHSLVGVGAVMALSYLLAKYYGLTGFAVGITTGAFLHILADLFTHHGIELMYPFTSKRFKMPITIETSGIIEQGLLVATAGAFLVKIL